MREDAEGCDAKSTICVDVRAQEGWRQAVGWCRWAGRRRWVEEERERVVMRRASAAHL